MNLFYTRLLRAAGVTAGAVPTVYFSIGEVELQSLTTKETFGDYAAWNYFQSVDRPENRVFIEKFRARYGRQRVISDPMEAGYIGARLWAQAVEVAGSAEAPQVREALRGQTFDGPGGRVRIDPDNQHTWKTIRLGKIVDGGQFEVVWSSERPIRPEPFPPSRSPSEWKDFIEALHRNWNDRWTEAAG
jgi:urea transport system substrate-binding protein